MTVHEIRIKISKDKISYRYGTLGGEPELYSQEKLKHHFSLVLIFHKVLNAYRLSKIKIFKADDFKILGETLGKILFPIQDETYRHPDIAILNRRFRDASIDSSIRCIIYLEFSKDASTVAMLPWEYLQLAIRSSDQDKITEIYPAAHVDKAFDLIRSFPTIIDFEPPPPTSQLPVLFVLANCIAPHSIESARSLDQELNKISSATNGRVRFIQLPPPSYKKSAEFPFERSFVKSIRDALKDIDGPYVLHYLGHGLTQKKDASISFVGDDDEPDWISDKKFAKLISALEDKMPHIIALQACVSAQIPYYEAGGDQDREENLRGVALNLCLKQVPAVIGMQNDITESDSFLFFKEFYKSLSEGLDVAQSVTAGRSMLAKVMEARQDDEEDESSYSSDVFGSPVLFLSTEKPFSLMAPEKDLTSNTSDVSHVEYVESGARQNRDSAKINETGATAQSAAPIQQEPETFAQAPALPGAPNISGAVNGIKPSGSPDPSQK